MPIIIISDTESHRGSACKDPASLICQKKIKIKKNLLHLFINLSKIRWYHKKMY